jgi:hypothetical protein
MRRSVIRRLIVGKKLIVWKVIRLRARGEYLVTVEAPDHDAALKAALKMLRLDSVEAKRLLIRRA